MIIGILFWECFNSYDNYLKKHMNYLELKENTADIICASKKLIFNNRINRESVSVDLEIVLQVCENLLSNAMRYAETTVDIIYSNNERQLIINVSDDGKGIGII